MVLLSIKPKFVERIIQGEKKFEFRKSVFSSAPDKIYIYSSSPEKAIIGYFKADEIIKDNPGNLWTICNEYAGIEESEFFQYFSGKEIGYAIKIGDLEIFDEPINPYDVIENFTPPQSYYYIDETLFIKRKNKGKLHGQKNKRS